MTSAYKIAGSTVKDPISQVWDDRTPRAFSHVNAPLYSGKRSCTLTFNALTQADFDTWQAIDDGATHSITIYSPDFGTPTAYTCYARVTNAGLGSGGLIYGATIDLWDITA